MDRQPPFPFPNTNNNNNNNSTFSPHFPSFDSPQDPNSLIHHYHYQPSSYNNNNNFSSTPLPPPPPQQQMAAPNYDSVAAAYNHHQSFAGQPHFPTSWIVNDPSAAALPFHQPTYNYPHYHYFTQQQQQQQQITNALATKAARDNRKMVRQKTMNSTRSAGAGAGAGSSSSSSSLVPNLSSLQPPSTQNHDLNIPVFPDHHPQGINPPDSCMPSSQNKKKLKLVFKKELKNSDVSPLGRIVIPKKDAEENLPPLTSREGIKLVVRDLYSDQQWTLKYKFWSNNKSRMYVLENAGDFLKKNGLKMGDLIILYLDEEYHKYFFSIKRAEEITWEKELAEEEEAALALMIENLRQGDEQEELEANNLLTNMEMQGGAGSGPYNNTHMPSSSSSSHYQPGNGINFMEEFDTTVNHNISPSFDDICWMDNQHNYDGPH